MTMYLLDVASYQGALKTEDVVRAGFDAVNLKISHGVGQASVHPDLAGWVARSRAAGLGLSTFHFLTAAATGRAQADYAYTRMQALGLTAGTAHQADCEADATEAILRDYVIRMQQLLGRPVAVYSGDWWWASRGWNGAALSPYLWSATNDGYPGSYPGDTSASWQAGWGGWPALSVMQYAVDVLLFPDGTRGTIKVSKSAIRDPQVWAALTTGGPVATSQNGWTVDTTGALQDKTPVAGVSFPNGVRAGDVATVLLYLAGRFHAEVEPLHAGWCWGWFVRSVIGGASISNHASGTAVDFNAPQHLLGERGTFSATQVAAIRKILTSLGGVVRWGGDYTDRADEMHFEIHAGAAAVKAQADRIRAEEEEVTPEDRKLIAEEVAVRFKIGDKGVWDKGGSDFNSDASGWSIGARRQITNVVAPLVAQARAENAALESGTAALVQRLLDLVTAGNADGGGLGDTAVIVAKLEEVKAEVGRAAQAAGSAAGDQVLSALRAAAQAEASSLAGEDG